LSQKNTKEKYAALQDKAMIGQEKSVDNSRENGYLTRHMCTLNPAAGNTVEWYARSLEKSVGYTGANTLAESIVPVSLVR
jgi:hypothetical protein